MTIHRFGDFELDMRCFELRRADGVVKLQNKAFDLLAYLVAQRAHVVAKQELIVHVWSGMAVTESSLTRTVSDLRRVLGERAASQRFIATVRGRGYRFVARVSGGAFTSESSELARVQAQVEELRALVARHTLELMQLGARAPSQTIGV